MLQNSGDVNGRLNTVQLHCRLICALTVLLSLRENGREGGEFAQLCPLHVETETDAMWVGT